MNKLLIVMLLLAGSAHAQTTPQPLVFGIFIAGIEEGGRMFTPVRLLPFEHPDAMNHQFPNAMVFTTGEVDALVNIGKEAGLKLATTLQRYPRLPVAEWPYAEFAPPPGQCLAAATVTHSRETPKIPRLRALATFDGRPLVFIVDTRGMTLSERHMDRVTSMGLDMTRAQFLAGLQGASDGASPAGCRIVVYDK